jgi:hypothetical protein
MAKKKTVVAIRYQHGGREEHYAGEDRDVILVTAPGQGGRKNVLKALEEAGRKIQVDRQIMSAEVIVVLDVQR